MGTETELGRHLMLVRGELVLVTDRFPYDALPEFLEDEIYHLAAGFSSVTVVPRHPGPRMASRLPDNVRVDLSLAEALGFQHQRSSRFPITMLTQGMSASAAWHEIGRRPLSPLWALRCFEAAGEAEAIRRWASERQPPALGYTYWCDNAVLGLRAAWPGTPLCSRAHGFDLYAERRRPAGIPFQAQMVDALTWLTPVSDHGSRYLRSHYPDARSRISTSRLGIRDLGGLAPPAEHGGGRTLRVVSVSTITRVKRVPLIAAALSHLSRSGRETHWTHIGDGHQKSRVRRVLRGGPSNLTVDLQGRRSHADVRRILSTEPFDVFVNVSASEGAPVSLMEAQCVGLPTVATTVGGVAEVISGDLDILISANPSTTEVAAAVSAASALPQDLRAERRSRWAATYDEATTFPRFVADLMEIAQR